MVHLHGRVASRAVVLCRRIRSLSNRQLVGKIARQAFHFALEGNNKRARSGREYVWWRAAHHGAPPLVVRTNAFLVRDFISVQIMASGVTQQALSTTLYYTSPICLVESTVQRAWRTCQRLSAPRVGCT